MLVDRREGIPIYRCVVALINVLTDISHNRTGRPYVDPKSKHTSELSFTDLILRIRTDVRSLAYKGKAL